MIKISKILGQALNAFTRSVGLKNKQEITVQLKTLHNTLFNTSQINLQTKEMQAEIINHFDLCDRKTDAMHATIAPDIEIQDHYLGEASNVLQQLKTVIEAADNAGNITFPLELLKRYQSVSIHISSALNGMIPQKDIPDDPSLNSYKMLNDTFNFDNKFSDKTESNITPVVFPTAEETKTASNNFTAWAQSQTAGISASPSKGQGFNHTS